MTALTYFDVLQIAPSASGDEIKRAFRQAAKTCHPDKGGSDKLFQEIQQAYAVLSDESKRRQYRQECVYKSRSSGNFTKQPYAGSSFTRTTSGPPRKPDAKYGQ
eukprot:9466427-Pyramimonas_sp.AAC.1